MLVSWYWRVLGVKQNFNCPVRSHVQFLNKSDMNMLFSIKKQHEGADKSVVWQKSSAVSTPKWFSQTAPNS